MSRIYSPFGSDCWPLAAIALVLVAGCLSGCGGDVGPGTSNDSAVDSGTIVRTTGAQAPVISGTAAATVTAGQAYAFQPQVSGGSGATLKFQISNMPAWAAFDAATGKLSGMPAAKDIGAYKSIQIAVTDGITTASLPAFSVTVAAASSAGTISLSWNPPTENSDGTSLVDLQGYNVHYGTSAGAYSQVVKVSNPGLTSYVVQNLAVGKYYFSVSAYNSQGLESNFSAEVSASVNN